MANRKQGWYWVYRRIENGTFEYWSIMYWDSEEWLISGKEYPALQDSDMLKIMPDRLTAPDEQ